MCYRNRCVAFICLCACLLLVLAGCRHGKERLSPAERKEKTADSLAAVKLMVGLNGRRSPEETALLLDQLKVKAEKGGADQPMLVYFGKAIFLYAAGVRDPIRARRLLDSMRLFVREHNTSLARYNLEGATAWYYNTIPDKKDSALAHFINQLKLAEQDTSLWHYTSLSSLYCNVAYMYQQQHNYAQAETLFRKALQCPEITGKDGHVSVEMASAVYGGLGSIYMLRNDTSRTLEMMRKALAIARMRPEDNRTIYESLEGLGGAFMTFGMQDSAMGYLNACINYADTHDSTMLFLEPVSCLAEIYMAHNDTAKAYKILQRGIAALPYNLNYEMRAHYFSVRALVARHVGKPAEALVALEESNKIKDTVASMQKNEQLLNYEKEITHLKATAELKAKEAKIRQQQLIFIVLIFIVAALGFLAYMLRKRRIARLEDENVLLQQEAFFNQLNPHFIANTLTPLQGRIIEGRDEEAVEYLAGFGKLMRSLISRQRKGMISVAFEERFLTSYLKLMQGGAQYMFTYDIVIDPAIDPEHTWVPSLLLQPVVENALKHGISGLAGGHIKVVFKKADNRLEVSITDNGKGIDEGAMYKDSHAMQILKERIELYKKQFPVCRFNIINTCPGVKVLVVLPLLIKENIETKSPSAYASIYN